MTPAPVSVDLDRVVEGLQAYAWPFLRVSGFLMVAPVLGANMVPKRVRLVLAVALAVALAPAVPATRIEPFSAVALLTAAQQVLTGVAIAFAVQVAFDALTLAGGTIATTMGLGFSTTVDPARGVSTPVVAQFFQIVGVLLFLALDAHWALLGVLAESFRTIPPGPDGIGTNGLSLLAGLGGRIFEAGLLIALPAVVGLLVVNLALGVVSRAAPQLNLFAVGFPISMAVGFGMLILTLPALRAGFERLLEDSLASALAIVGAGQG